MVIYYLSIQFYISSSMCNVCKNAGNFLIAEIIYTLTFNIN